MSETWKDKFSRWFTITLVAVIFVGGLLLAWPNYQRGRALRAQNAELSAQIDRKRLEISDLVENQRRFKTDSDFLEQIARQNHRVYPGELVFIFEDK